MAERVLWCLKGPKLITLGEGQVLTDVDTRLEGLPEVGLGFSPVLFLNELQLA